MWKPVNSHSPLCVPLLGHKQNFLSLQILHNAVRIKKISYYIAHVFQIASLQISRSVVKTLV